MRTLASTSLSGLGGFSLRSAFTPLRFRRSISYSANALTNAVSGNASRKEEMESVDGVVLGWANSVRIAPEPEGLQPQQPSEGASVAQHDAERFKLDKSVGAWSGFTTRYSSLGTEGSDVTTLLRDVAAESATKDTRAAMFWAYHSARLSFFVAQAVGGLLAHDISERFQARHPDHVTMSGSSSQSGGNGFGSEIAARLLGPSGGSELVARASESVGMWRQDLEYIEAGYYKLPWDMTTVTHRQFNPLFMFRRSMLFFDEAAKTLGRRVRGAPEPVWLQGPSLYPSYFQKTYHYQSDGWLSESSAEVYEHSTETLFFGRQDAMQRASLVPISKYIQGSGKPPSELRLLEVASGTGRFHTFIKDNWPEMPSVLSDLSPFYLAKARENIEYWHNQIHRGQKLGGGPDGANVEYLQTAAEDIAAPDESFDILTCTYLFHELPEPIRRRAVVEFFRVLKPGGLMVFNDSAQLGDRPEWDRTIGNFSNFNEPYYRNYVACNLGAMFQDAGFIPDIKILASASKVLTFIKP